MLAERKRFRIEGPGPAWPTRAPAVDPLAASPVPVTSTGATSLSASLSPDGLTRDMIAIEAELDAMRGAIAAMRRDVASMQRSGAGHAGVHRAACELDAVFDATERATTTILGAVEDIESAAILLRGSGLDAGRDDYVGTILGRVVLLYETCNFQDVTGQRIEKVVATLKFIEERLDAMAGGAKSGAVGIAPSPRRSDEPAMHGPALAIDERNSQSDIDSYFG